MATLKALAELAVISAFLAGFACWILLIA